MALLYSEDTEILIGCLMNVHNDIGPGLAESIYQEGCETEFSSKAISFESQVSNWVIHRGAKVKELVPDFVMGNKIILDLKAIFGSFPPAAYTQIINYCKLFHMDLGILVNFGMQSLSWKRVPYTQKTGPIEIHGIECRERLPIRKDTLFQTISQVFEKVLAFHGLGYTDEIYAGILMIEFGHVGLHATNGPTIRPVFQGSCQKETNIPVIVVEGKYPIYVSSLRKTIPAAILARMQTYTKFLALPYGIIANFGNDRLQIECVASRTRS